MINAHKEGIPGNGKPFPRRLHDCKDRVVQKKGRSVYFVDMPDTLKSVSFIEKDSQRFPDTRGWGYAQFLCDAASDTIKPFGSDSSFGKKICYQCYTLVTAKDFIFTGFTRR